MGSYRLICAFIISRSNQVDFNSQNNDYNRSKAVNRECYPRYSNEQKQTDKTRSGSYSEASSAYSGSDAMQVIYIEL